MAEHYDGTQFMNNGVQAIRQQQQRFAKEEPWPTNTGGARPKFVEAVELEFICQLCRLELLDPVQTPCGQRVCRSCIISKFSENSQASIPCPLTHDDDDNFGLDFIECKGGLRQKDIISDCATRNLLFKQKVYCTNAQYGCTTHVIWKKLEEHLSSCAFVPMDCVNKCNGCMEKIPFDGLEKHKDSCGFAKMQCKHCSASFLRVERHEEECPEAPRTCCVCGRMANNKAAMDIHKSLNHFERPTSCFFSEYGCEAELNAEDEFKKHYTNSAPKHFQILTLMFADMETQRFHETSKTASSKNDSEYSKTAEEKLKIKHRQLEKFMASINYSLTDISLKVDQGVSVGQNAGLANTLQAVKRQLDAIEKRIPSSNGSESLSQKAREIAELNMRLVETDGRLRRISVGLTPGAGFTGVLLWKISDYQKRKQDAAAGRNVSFYSLPFYSSEAGYKMCGRIYLNGDGLGKGKCLSLFFAVMKGDFDDLLPWPFVWRVTFSILCPGNPLLDHSETFTPDKESSSFRKPITDMNMASGCPEFKLQSEVESKYLKNDTIFVKIQVHPSM